MEKNSLSPRLSDAVGNSMICAANKKLGDFFGYEQKANISASDFRNDF